MLKNFFINWNEEPIKIFEIGLENIRCEITNGILEGISEKIEKSFPNHEEAKKYFENEMNLKIKEGYFETFEPPKLEDIVNDEDLGLVIKLHDFYMDYYTHIYLDSFKAGSLIFLETEDGEITERSKRIYQELINNQTEIKNKIDLALFENHKSEFEDCVETQEKYGIKDDYENFEKTYKPHGQITTYEEYKKLGMPTYQEIMEQWELIKKVSTLEEKQEILYKEIKLNEIVIFPEDYEEDIGFGFEYESFDPEHGLGIKLKNWEVVDVCSNNDLW